MTTSNIASEELAAVEVAGMSRSSFLMKSALTVGAVYGTAAIGPFVGKALAQEGGGDVEILNFALTLEYLEADFYAQAQKLELEPDVAKLAKLFGDQEAEHAAALADTVSQLGGTPVEKPTFTFPMEDQASFLKLAQTLEDTGVSAYNGAGPQIEAPEVLAAAGSIVQIEGRHAAAIRLLNEDNPAPNAFDETLEMQAVLDAIQPFVKT